MISIHPGRFCSSAGVASRRFSCCQQQPTTLLPPAPLHTMPRAASSGQGQVSMSHAKQEKSTPAVYKGPSSLTSTKRMRSLLFDPAMEISMPLTPHLKLCPGLRQE